MLLILNIIVEFAQKPAEENPVNETSRRSLENTLWNTIQSYGIKSEWITTKIYKKTEHDSLEYYFNIKFPHDLPLVLFLNELNAVYSNSDVKLEAVEKVNHANSILTFSVNNNPKLRAEIIYDKQIVRDYSEFTFLIDISDEPDSVKVEEILKLSAVPFIYLLQPSNYSEQIIKYLAGRTDFAIILGDAVQAERFSMNEKMNKNSLKKSITNLISIFGRNAEFFIDSNSELYRSAVYNFIRDEFARYQIILNPSSIIVKLDVSGEDELKSLFEFHVVSSKLHEKKLFSADIESFNKLMPEIIKLKKAGHRFSASIK